MGKKLNPKNPTQESALHFRVSGLRHLYLLKYKKPMMYKSISILFALFLISISGTSQSLADQKAEIASTIETKKDYYFDIALKIWNLAELGYQETESSQLLQSELEQNGFTIEKGVGGMPTAFIASVGSGEPVIALLGEFDALPGVSQSASPFREKREEVNAGHACGHHLFGTGSMAAAINVKHWMQENKIAGTLRFYGTPAEEGGAGKVYMVREGLFDDVDAVLHWHPSSGNAANAASSLANKSAKFRFYGVASHAAGSPWNGRSALDGVEAMNMMVNMMREHISPDSRIHHVITSGGEAPNVVPEFAEVFYYCRHPQMSMVKQNFEWMVEIAEAAAKGTKTTMEYEVIHGLFNVLPNENLSRIVHNNLREIGGYKYTPEEKEYADKIIASFEYAANVSTSLTENVAPFKVIKKGQGGSTDVGDVSWAVPTAGLRTATWVPGTSAHTWQAVAAGGTSIGQKGMILAAKTLALSAMDFFTHTDVLAKAKEELNSLRGPNYKYEALLGDRKPPLDYRK